ncbi:SDR family NAD(P)-dependent oxidoreductase [Sorangium sp. So ce375]|uniref:SDR family NAD(P)-dependent oxidoreductase n=1 Tax=Sorangium sp. So ce375 TaxID=3133306 RepID=UPI003F5B5B37
MLEVRKRIGELVRAELAAALGVPAETLDPDASFHRHGLDSLRAVQVAAALSEKLGRRVSPTLLWEHSTMVALVAYLASPGREPEPTPVARAVVDEPIAVVGMACRLPGAESLDAFWTLLRDRVSAVSEVPRDRWTAEAIYAELGDARPEGSERLRWGAFLDHIDAFDTRFFGISPREATDLDPQQRLMLELAWEAVEDAGIRASDIRDSRTGVYCGLIWSDYDALIHQRGLRGQTTYTATGNQRSIVANRISYFLGARGPSMAIDSACSSGLVAIHLACEGLRSGESTLALAGAVNLNILPESALGVERCGVLSPDGRCYTFDARANGYVRGEGGVVVVLQRLSQALAEGNRIYCLVMGSAVNNDGASNGLTAPNARAQADVLREACQRAGLDPSEVQYVEAHGTGTPLGDPIEASALGKVYGNAPGRREPLRVGSVKTNVGHLEGAAGLVGFVKTALCLHHGELVPSLNYESPNPLIDVDALGIRVQTQREPWSDPAATAGVSSFGIGGTNSHALVRRWRPSVVFVCPGQGAQWVGMGVALLDAEPAFRAVIEACDRQLQAIAGWSLIDELRAPVERSRLDRIEVSLPAIIAIDIALAELWRSWGIEPGAVVGHSTGEIAAACIAGVLSLEHAMQVICGYGNVVARQRGLGGMGMIGLPWDAAAEVLLGYEGRVFRAIRDSRTSTVLAGEPVALNEVLEAAARRGIFARRVSIDVSPHSPLVEWLLGDLRASFEGVEPRRGRAPFYSEVTGGRLEDLDAGPEHWVRNFVEPADFSGAVNALLAEGHSVFIEVGPHALNRRSLETDIQAHSRFGQVLSSVRRGEDELAVLAETRAALDRLGLVQRRDGKAARRPSPVVISARSPAALAGQTERLLASRALAEERLVDVAYSLATRRSHFEHRLAVVGRDADEVRERLRTRELKPSSSARLAFLFTGQGAQRADMARGLAEAYPVVGDALAEALDLLGQPGLLKLADLERTGRAQPALFAVGYALHRLWESWGVRPDVVLGHSLGEVTAACVAGVFSLRDACRLVRARASLMDALPEGGAMVSVATSFERVAPLLTAGVSVAAINGPTQVVLSGDEGRVMQVVAALTQQGVPSQRLQVSHAFHSARMEPMLDDFRAELEQLEFRPATIPLVSNVSGRLAGAEILTPDYWLAQVREPVRFMDGVAALGRVGTLLELGPHPVLCGMAKGCLPADAGLTFVASLRRDHDEVESVWTAACALFEQGVDIDWESVFAGQGARRVQIPTYAFDRQRYWLPEPEARLHGRAGAYSLAGLERGLPDGGAHHVLRLRLGDHPGLADHRVYGQVVVPGSYFLVVALSIAAQRWPGQAIRLEDVQFMQAAVLDDEVDIHVQLTPQGDGFRFTISTQLVSEDSAPAGWMLHAQGLLGTWGGAPPRPPELPREAVRSGTEVFDALAAVGVAWSAGWRWLTDLWVIGDTAFASLQPPVGRGSRALGPVDPGLLDNGFGLAATAWRATDEAWLPMALHRLVWRPGARARHCRHHVRNRAESQISSDLVYWGEDGVVIEVEGFATRRAPRGEFLGRQEDRSARWIYELAWTARPSLGATSMLAGEWLVVDGGGEHPALEPLVEELRKAVLRTTLSHLGREHGVGDGFAGVVVVWGAEPTPNGLERVGEQALALLQTHARGGADTTMIWVTQRAMGPGRCDDPGGAALWGLARSFRSEHPDRRLTCVDVDDFVALARLPEALARAAEEPELAIRGDSVLVPRLVPAPRGSGRPLAFREGTVIVTGGLGGLGQQVARWLAQQGVRHLMLVSRRGHQTPGAASVVRELERIGARVTLVAADISREAETLDLIARVPHELPLTGIVHTAAVLDDGIVVEQDAQRFRPVMAAKARGAWNLHTATLNEKLDFFVLFSSAAGVLGTSGQANYAAANVFLDALAQHRRARGLPAHSLAWGPWSGVGLAAGMSDSAWERIARQGIHALAVEEGLGLLADAMGRDQALLVLLRVELGALERSLAEGGSVTPLWRDLVQAKAAIAKAPSSFGDHLDALAPEARRDSILALLRQITGDVLGMRGAPIPSDVPLQVLGLDSLMAIEIRNRIASRMGAKLPMTLLLDYPVLDGLAQHLLELVLKPS